MPLRPKHPCSHPGCGTLVKTRYCEQHTRAAERQRDRYRGLPSERGYGHDWRRLRRMKINADPLCEMCLARGETRLAEEVDHKIRITERPDLRLEMDNLQSLCRDCHAAKSTAERSGRPIKGCDERGRPLDPSDPWANG